MTKANRHRPPRWAEKFLEWYCRPELLEDLQGDLNEFFHRNLNAHGLRWARFQYVLDVLKFFRLYLVKAPVLRFNWSLYVHYSKSAFRSYKKDGFNTCVNVISLTLGISAFLFIATRIYTELSYDRHYAGAAQIYRVTTTWKSDADVRSTELGWSLAALPGQLRYSFPEVDGATGIVRFASRLLVKTEEGTFLENDFYQTDTSYFELFETDWIYGEAKEINAASIVLTQSLAQKYFGDSVPIGKVIDVDGELYKVCGVVKDVPVNSSLRYKALLFTLTPQSSDWCFTFLKLDKKSDEQALQQRLDTLFTEQYASILSASNTSGAYHLEKLTGIHLGEPKMMDAPKGSRPLLFVLATLALIVLLISLFNYTNLTVAHTSGRAREVGIRMAMGAQRIHTYAQRFTETAWIMLASTCIAVVVQIGFWPLMGRGIFVQHPMRTQEVLILVGVMITMILLTSVVVSIVTSRRHTSSDTLPSKIQWARSGVMVFQFAASIAFVFAADIIADQVKLISGKALDHGDQIMIIDLPQERKWISQTDHFKTEIERLSGVVSSSLVGPGTFEGNSETMDIFSVDIPGGQGIRTLPYTLVDEDFFQTFNLDFIAGKNFTSSDSTGSWETVIVNEAFLKSQGWENDPLSHRICYGTFCDGVQISGVVRDAGFQGYYQTEKPMLYFPNHRQAEKLIVKLRRADDDNIKHIKKRWMTTMEGSFEFRFLDEYFSRQLEHERSLQQQVRYFSIITVIIAAVGLMGMISISIAQHKKETAIRKIFGAALSDMLIISWKSNIICFALAVVIAYPLMHHGLKRWLENYPHKAPLTIGSYLIAVAIMTGVISLTLMYHAFKLKNSKPLDVIRYE